MAVTPKVNAVPVRHRNTTKRLLSSRRWRFVTVAGWLSLGWLQGGTVQAAVDDFSPGSQDVGDYENFLRPESIGLRGCTPYSLPESDQPPRVDRDETSDHYCVADFVDSEEWEFRGSRAKSRLSFPFDRIRNGDVLAAELSTTGASTAKKVGFSITSKPVSEVRFDTVDAVRIWVKGNGSSAGLRVWLADRDGEAFTHQKPLRLNFGTWAEEHLSFASDYVVSHGKLANKHPDPPMVLQKISVTGSPEAMRGEIRIDGISLIGTPWRPHPSIENRTAPERDNKTKQSHAAVELRLAKRPSRPAPMNVGSVPQLKLILTNNRKSAVDAHIESTVHRVLGETKSVGMTQRLSAGARREISVPVDLAFPGWYRLVVCARVDQESSCVRDEFLAWDAVGNDVEDTPKTFPGAMLSADTFVSDLRADLQLMRQAGVKVLRFPFRWEKIEPQQGKYNWRTYDTIFEQCYRANIIPQPMIVQTPDWARRAPYRKSQGGKSATAFSPPEDMETFRAFSEKAAKRYAKYSPYWEVWNEPINHFWTGGTNEDYIELLRAGYTGIKAADSSAQVLSGGAWAVDGRPAEFSRHLMENGRDFFEILAVHSHGGVHRLKGDLGDVEDLWAEAGRQPRIWLNETGVNVDPRRSDGELIKAAETVKKMVVARARGVENFGWFIFKHYPNSYRSPYGNYSALDERGEPRPVLIAYNNANRLLRRSRVERAENEAAGYAAYEFRARGRRILVAWSLDGATAIPVTQFPAWVADGVDIYDLFGGPATVNETSQSSALELTGSPVFVVGRDAAP